eukprot:TRINITY_DN10335_c0_g3_i2.p1 TRINITY_DN10335_c0_g3~~TRINITY_DN10335_c0_g3_i2.p1  ORF type:complete len:150 (-),score=36.41 TRINITY_DN10335_c0_g3_i2:86-535(-)
MPSRQTKKAKNPPKTKEQPKAIKGVKKQKRESKPKNTPLAREYTFNVHRAVMGMQFKKRAPKAIKELRKFAQKQMHTVDVRIDTAVNQFLWSKGIRMPPNKIRVRFSRRKNEDEDAKEEMYTLVSFIPATNFHGLKTVIADESGDAAPK